MTREYLIATMAASIWTGIKKAGYETSSVSIDIAINIAESILREVEARERRRLAGHVPSNWSNKD